MIQVAAKEIGTLAAQTLEKEVVNEVSKKSFNEVYSNLQPNELISKSQEIGITFDNTEIQNMLKELDKALVKEISPYSNEINEFIKNPNELKVYENANLEESIVNDRLVLKTNEINPNLIDSFGRTNIERMEKGLSPIDESGNSYNLHHIGQKMNSPLAELTQHEHNIYDKILHDKTIKTEIHNDTNELNWSKERKKHWQTRAKEIME